MKEEISKVTSMIDNLDQLHSEEEDEDSLSENRGGFEEVKEEGDSELDSSGDKKSKGSEKSEKKSKDGTPE